MRRTTTITVATARTPRWLALAAALALLALTAPSSPAGAQEAVESRGIDVVCPPPPDFAATDVSFDDTGGHTHEASIDCVAAYGIARGFDDGGFQPGQPVSRAQMATFVAVTVETARGEELSGGQVTRFPDTAGNVHEENINKLANNGIVSGTSPTTYSPEQPVSRAQMATFVANAIDFSDNGAVDGSEPPATEEQFFDDTEDSVHGDNINRLRAQRIVVGDGTGSYLPTRDTLRGQMATFVMQSADYLAEIRAWEPTLEVTFEVAVSWINEIDASGDEPVFGVGDEGATGHATLTIDTVDNTVTYDFSGEDLTSGPADLGEIGPLHIHDGELEENGPIVVPLNAEEEVDWDPSAGTVATSGTVDAGEFDVLDIVADPHGYYVNYHTEDNPGGAIRGQLPDGGQDLIEATFVVTMSWENGVDTSGDEPVFGVGDEGATGEATLTISRLGNTVVYDFSGEGLSAGPADLGEIGPLHIHVGELEENGPIVVPLNAEEEVDWDAEAGTASTSGTVAASADAVAAILADPAGYYVNYHTEEYPGGAIRGQLPDGGQDRLPSE